MQLATCGNQAGGAAQVGIWGRARFFLVQSTLLRLTHAACTGRAASTQTAPEHSRIKDVERLLVVLLPTVCQVVRQPHARAACVTTHAALLFVRQSASSVGRLGGSTGRQSTPMHIQLGRPTCTLYAPHEKENGWAYRNKLQTFRPKANHPNITCTHLLRRTAWSLGTAGCQSGPPVHPAARPPSGCLQQEGQEGQQQQPQVQQRPACI